MGAPDRFTWYLQDKLAAYLHRDILTTEQTETRLLFLVKHNVSAGDTKGL